MNFPVFEIPENDLDLNKQAERLLAAVGLKKDVHVDHTYGIVNEARQLIAVGSCAGKTLRCIAVAPEYEGKGVLNVLVSQLAEEQVKRGNTSFFVYTKAESAPFFKSLGFHEVARAWNDLVFLESKRHGFGKYLQSLGGNTSEGAESSGAVVINANPFTCGHQRLIEYASREKSLHVFVVSEDASEFSYQDRLALVRMGCGRFRNVMIHPSGDYMISMTTFPQYFLKDSCDAARVQAGIDAQIFIKIARFMNIHERFFGEEPANPVVNIYNEAMRSILPAAGIQCRILPRFSANGRPISASFVRKALLEGRLDSIRNCVPESTFSYLQALSRERITAMFRKTK